MYTHVVKLLYDVPYLVVGLTLIETISPYFTDIFKNNMQVPDFKHNIIFLWNFIWKLCMVNRYTYILFSHGFQAAVQSGITHLVHWNNWYHGMYYFFILRFMSHWFINIIEINSIESVSCAWSIIIDVFRRNFTYLID